MATCKGCGFVCKTPRAQNWKNYQLCYACYLAKIENKPPDHGTGVNYRKNEKPEIFAVPSNR